MKPFRFAHAGDLHIDSPFKGLRDVNSQIAGELREATYAAFRNLVDLCKEKKVDFLLLSGDVYDTADRSPRAQIRFRNGLAELAAEGIESFVVHGNHDPLNGQFSSITWPHGVHIFGENPSRVTATSDGEPVADIQGVSFAQQEVRENLALRFTKPSTQDLFNIGLLHCNVGGISGHDNYAPCTRDDLINAGLDYWALGHIHARQNLSDKNPVIAYPGNTQGRDPGEQGAKGCLVVDVDAGGQSQMQFHPLDVVR